MGGFFMPETLITTKYDQSADDIFTSVIEDAKKGKLLEINNSDERLLR